MASVYRDRKVVPYDDFRRGLYLGYEKTNTWCPGDMVEIIRGIVDTSS